MSLLVDRRAEIGPRGTHALIVGISAYPHLRDGAGEPAPIQFGMTQLSSAATTALNLATYLEGRAGLAAPLSTCRLLASPGEVEREMNPEFDGVDRATLSAFLHACEAWRHDAATSRDHVALLYLVGHGVQHGHADHVFLLEDFGDRVGPLFRNAATLSSIVDGMAPGSFLPDVARTQIVVFDASRVPAPDDYALRLDSATPVFDVERAAVDDRDLLTMYAATPGGQAFASRHGSLFSAALMRCLDGAAATPVDPEALDRWGVTTRSLVSGLQHEAAALIERHKVPVRFDFGGSIGDTLLLEFDRPPLVDLVVEVNEAAGGGRLVLITADDEEIVLPDAEDGVTRSRVPAGLYRLTLQPPPDSDAPPVRHRWRMVAPPGATWSIALNQTRHA